MTIEAVVFDRLWHALRCPVGRSGNRGRLSVHGMVITQLWRLKQLEYTWLRSLMGQYATSGR